MTKIKRKTTKSFTSQSKPEGESESIVRTKVIAFTQSSQQKMKKNRANARQ